MTLGNASVPAGSLLVFNGYANPDRVIAVNPASGAVIASLVLAGNYDLTAACTTRPRARCSSPRTTGRATGCSSIDRGNRRAKMAITVPLNVAAWSGLAIDPASGNLWLGSTQGNEVVASHPCRESKCAASTPGRPGRQPERDHRPGLRRRRQAARSPPPRAWSTGSTRQLDARRCPRHARARSSRRATNGVAANAALAAANVGQVIELVGSQLRRRHAGAVQHPRQRRQHPHRAAAPLVINAAGTRLQVLVPDLATTGDVRVVNHGTLDLGFSGSYVDAVYRNVTLHFTAGSATRQRSASPTAGCEGLGNESWGIDNVRVQPGRQHRVRRRLRVRHGQRRWSDARVDSERAGHLQPLQRALQQRTARR